MTPADWPHRAHSLFIESAPHRWHIQRMGQGPTALLLHGAGASTHSFAPLMSRLADHFDLVAVDLPGQGFTQLGTRGRCGLSAMAEDIAALCASLDLTPQLIVGHSAGAAIALRLSTCLPQQPREIVGINGAFAEFEGLAGLFFPMMAKALTLNPFVAGTFSRLAGSKRNVQRLIEGTGSTISAEGLSCYQHLVSQPAHVEATLAMMAQWNLAELRAIVQQIETQCRFLVGNLDKAVPPRTSEQLAHRLANAACEYAQDVGHLLHEEAPDLAANFVRSGQIGQRSK
ncbi:alpha/beta fold hydrolase BchO [Pontivivens insulae]|uniref:2-(Acetamidomethylene)succinate hydrolase n=1 Tax=Pontivivens insulae TaxID=1639689 RepID=A0A2R8AA71_9RHOB|nr:alpha/beta fold hydrolase BchO [Pontivivens insulae]RED12898.1 magnesium chelatase accessory protein [Pontivivens insulae]SPF28990.1 2-(acetamidomethylene)succinate hydrolase [Pontivivens insulae]